MVVQLWLLQLWNCGFHSHGIVTVMVMELWLLRLLNVAIAFIDLLPELQKATINWLSMAVQCHHEALARQQQNGNNMVKIKKNRLQSTFLVQWLNA